MHARNCSHLFFQFGYPEMMQIQWLPALAFLIFCFLFHRRKTSSVPVNWPVVGMLPGIISHFQNLHDYVVDILRDAAGRSFIVRGPWFLGMNFLLTCDPANINHIFNTHFHDYAKGEEFKEMFSEILGDGILAAEIESWKVQRKMAHAILTDQTFRSFAADAVVSKIRDGLIPLLRHMAHRDAAVDLQDVFTRFAFASNYMIVMGADSDCLSTSLPAVDFMEGIHCVEEAIIFRQSVPPYVWKLLRWLNVGGERKLAMASQVIDRFINEEISKRRSSAKEHDACSTAPDMLTALYMNRSGADEGAKRGGEESKLSDKFLRDIILSFMAAGSDSAAVGLTWFFYLVAKYPNVERKILEELEALSPEREEESEGASMFTASRASLQSMVYLQAALMETLRLFPPLPLDHKGAFKDDVLPSGVRVRAGMRIIIGIYALGRMEEVWGEDCMEFKPERWIGKDGRLRHEPTYKFMTFGTGPRSCIGREHALALMKMAAASVVYNFRFELVEGRDFKPMNSVLLYMADGCMVRVKKRLR